MAMVVGSEAGARLLATYTARALGGVTSSACDGGGCRGRNNEASDTCCFYTPAQ
jgi:hypothetical protein